MFIAVRGRTRKEFIECSPRTNGLLVGEGIVVIFGDRNRTDLGVISSDEDTEWKLSICSFHFLLFSPRKNSEQGGWMVYARCVPRMTRSVAGGPLFNIWWDSRRSTEKREMLIVLRDTASKEE